MTDPNPFLPALALHLDQTCMICTYRSAALLSSICFSGLLTQTPLCMLCCVSVCSISPTLLFSSIFGLEGSTTLLILTHI